MISKITRVRPDVKCNLLSTAKSVRGPTPRDRDDASIIHVDVPHKFMLQP